MAKLTTQHVTYDGAGERGRTRVVQSGVQHVRGHDGGDVGGDRLAERFQVLLAHLLRRVLDDRQLHMRVDARVSVPGKVLAARCNAVPLQGLDDDATEASHLDRIGGQGPVADDRVGLGVSHVEYRRKVERNPDRPQFVSQRGCETSHQRRIYVTTERRHGRPFGERRPQPGHPSSLLIDTHPQWRVVGQRLQVKGQFGHLLWRLNVPREENHPAQAPLASQRAQLGRHGATVEPGHHKLPDVTMECFHGLEGRIQPDPCGRGSAWPRSAATAGRFRRRRLPATGRVPERRRAARRHYNAPVQIHSSAPTRLDLGGGTLDIWPLYLFHPGAQTVNVAIQLRAACTVTSRNDGAVTIVSEDTGRRLTANRWDQLDTTGDNRLLAHIARFFEVEGIQISTRAASPLGAGIAGSSALTIAVCAALARWQQRRLSSQQLLTLAMNLETRTLRIPTGVQDYYAALHGGVSVVALDPLGVTRTPLDIEPDEWQRRLVLVYSGDSRSSGINNWDITRRYIDGDQRIAAAFDRLRDIAAAIRDALERRDWTELAVQINREWRARRTLAPGISTAAIDRLMERATAAGALAGKVCGAGGGGCIFFLVDPARRIDVVRALTGDGARLLDCRIDTDGVLVAQDGG